MSTPLAPATLEIRTATQLLRSLPIVSMEKTGALASCYAEIPPHF
jgi:hypothetical protein